MPTLSGILQDARTHNERDNITGALICRHDIFLQLLEGPRTKVKAAFERISGDDRHAGVRELVSETLGARIFGDWAMLHDPADSLIWTEDEISKGALERATAQDFKDMFVTLAAKVQASLPE